MQGMPRPSTVELTPALAQHLGLSRGGALNYFELLRVSPRQASPEDVQTASSELLRQLRDVLYDRDLGNEARELKKLLEGVAKALSNPRDIADYRREIEAAPQRNQLAMLRKFEEDARAILSALDRPKPDALDVLSARARADGLQESLMLPLTRRLWEEFAPVPLARDEVADAPMRVPEQPIELGEEPLFERPESKAIRRPSPPSPPPSIGKFPTFPSGGPAPSVPAPMSPGMGAGFFDMPTMGAPEADAPRSPKPSSGPIPRLRAPSERPMTPQPSEPSGSMKPISWKTTAPRPKVDAQESVPSSSGSGLTGPGSGMQIDALDFKFPGGTGISFGGGVGAASPAQVAPALKPLDAKKTAKAEEKPAPPPVPAVWKEAARRAADSLPDDIKLAKLDVVAWRTIMPAFGMSGDETRTWMLRARGKEVEVGAPAALPPAPKSSPKTAEKNGGAKPKPIPESTPADLKVTEADEGAPRIVSNRKGADLPAVDLNAVTFEGPFGASPEGSQNWEISTATPSHDGIREANEARFLARVDEVTKEHGGLRPGDEPRLLGEANKFGITMGRGLEIIRMRFPRAASDIADGPQHAALQGLARRRKIVESGGELKPNDGRVPDWVPDHVITTKDEPRGQTIKAAAKGVLILTPKGILNLVFSYGGILAMTVMVVFLAFGWLYKTASTDTVTLRDADKMSPLQSTAPIPTPDPAAVGPNPSNTSATPEPTLAPTAAASVAPAPGDATAPTRLATSTATAAGDPPSRQAESRAASVDYIGSHLRTQATFDPPMLVDVPARFLDGGIYVEAFALRTTEVTIGEYEEFCTQTGHKPPTDWPNGKPRQGAKPFPVTGVSMDDAAAFCQWKGLRDRLSGMRYMVPLEKQYRVAMRDATAGVVGGAVMNTNMPHPATVHAGDTLTVENKQLFHLYGNVAEWVRPEVERGDTQIVGAGWTEARSVDPRGFRVFEPARTSPVVGFRYVRERQPLPEPR